MLLYRTQKDIFGERLKSLRKKRFHTQDDFAEAMEVSVNSVKKWESGRVLPETKHLFRISALLDCDIDYLTGRIDYKAHDIPVSCDYTGLSEKAIETLHEWTNTAGGKVLLFTLSSLIEQKNHFRAVLSCAWNFFNPPKKETEKRETVMVIDTSGIIPSAEETSLFMASNNLVNCIKEASEQYQK